jgi:hypothetical protein
MKKNTWLISEFTKNPHERDGHKIKLYMEANYAAKGFFLNGRNKPPAIISKDHWPFLLTGESFLEHFTRLMGFDLTARFQEHSSAKGRLLTS